jgi:N-acetylmuramoyl-L-alanine amidase
MRTVVIDPGHGGVDPGAISISGHYEKDIVLATARQLNALLVRTRDIHPELTRSDDVFIPLEGRVECARKLHADLFISIHADSIPDPRTRGASVFTLSEKASDKLAARLAARENDADLLAGVDLSHEPKDVGRILLDLARRQTANRSARLAQCIVRELRRDIVLLDPCHRSAAFVVLKTVSIPAVLVEIGCLSNRTEDRHLRSRRYRQRIARHLAHGIHDYFRAVT